MASLAFLFGSIPSTEKVESADDQLRVDYAAFQEYEKSDELKHYLELEAEVSSGDFATRKKAILKESYKSSEEYRKENSYKQLSRKAEKTKKAKEAWDIKEAKKVEKARKSWEANEAREAKKSEKAKKDKENKEENAGRGSGEVPEFSPVSYPMEEELTAMLVELAELETEINSDAFQKRKQYLSMQPKERYKTTKESATEQEYITLKQSEKVLWYFKTRKKYPFKEIEKWNETFNESFTGTKLNEKKWMTRYYWGDAILDEPYTMADDRSFPSDGKNIEIADGKVRLLTKKEETSGMKWDPLHGFLQDSFEFTSGLISTGNGFRQKYGIFKAKIKMSGTDLSQAFWMVSEGIAPHIDVARYEKGKLSSAYFWFPGEGKAPSKSISKTGGTKFTSDFFIFSLEWSPDKLVWKINDKVFKTQSSGVPQEEMYMVFSAALKEWGSDNGLPAAMEIDWVRAYKLKEQN